MKGRKQIDAQYVPPETPLIQRWIDQALDFFLSRWGFAPMNAGRFVVNRMVAIVEQRQVDQTHKITGMVVGRFFIGMDMLNVIENQHAEQRNLMRDHDEQNGLLPIQNKDCHGVVESQTNVLGSGKIEFWAVAAPQGS